MKKLTTALLGLVLPFFLLSQTIVDSLNVYGTWTKAESPYLINSDIAVASYDTLIIEPGVHVIFEDYYLFQIFGHFTAIGDENDSIVFTVSDTTGYSTNTHAGWGGLDFIDNFSEMQYCVVEYSKASGIFMYGTDFSLTNSSIRYNYYGIAFTSATFNINQVNVYNNESNGIHDYFNSNLSGSITDFEIFNNGGRGIFISPSAKNVNVFNGIIKKNQGGGLYIGYEAYPSIHNIIIEGNGSTEVDGGGIIARGGCFLDNLIIQNNIAKNGGGIASYIYGFEDMYLSNSTIENNVATQDGGGVYDKGDGTSLSNLQILNNHANNGGGIYVSSKNGIYSTYFTQDIFLSNNYASSNGGGIYARNCYCYSDVIIGGIVTNNIAGLNGGGIYTYNSYELGIEGDIVNNIAGQDGGGIYTLDCTGIDITNMEISNNSATNGGGVYFKGDGLHSVNYVEISNNNATNKGGAIYIDSINKSINFNHITNVFNTAEIFGGGVYASYTDTANVNIINSVMWNDDPDEIVDPTGNIIITYSNIEGGWTGTGNIDTNPLFLDPTNGDYNLSWLNFPLEDYTKSPCIESSSDSTDMGAYPFDRAYYEQFLPVIDSIPDVPNDQGKQVVLNWTRSILDNPYDGTIDKYTIWRKQNWAKEPWEYMGYTPAQNFEEYAFIAPTVSDSTANGIPYFTFMVSAVDDDLNKYYYSYPDSGYSIDNYAPAVPLDFTGNYNQDTVKLSWQVSPEEDFSYYSLYRSVDPNNFPVLPFATIENENYYDIDLVIDTLYYKLTATDINGNESASTDTLEVVVPKEVILDLKVYLEGPYLVTGMVNYLNLSGLLPYDQPYNSYPWYYEGIESVPSVTNLNIVDWMLVELRDATTVQEAVNSASIGKSAVFVLNDGNLIAHDQLSLPRIEAEIQNNLFIVLYHRNHMSIMSSSPVQQIDGVYTYNFAIGADKVYGGDYVFKLLGSGNWGMISGEASGDEQINNIDKNDFWYPEYLSNGYKVGDFNMNGTVDDEDKDDFLKPNFGKGIQEP